MFYNESQLKRDLESIFWHKSDPKRFGFYAVSALDIGQETLLRVYGQVQRNDGKGNYTPLTQLSMNDPLAEAILKEIVNIEEL